MGVIGDEALVTLRGSAKRFIEDILLIIDTNLYISSNALNLTLILEERRPRAALHR